MPLKPISSAVVSRVAAAEILNAPQVSSAVGGKLGACSVHLKLVPRPRSLGESRQVLQILRRYGEVSMFRHLKYDTENPAPNSFSAIFAHPTSATRALVAGSLEFAYGDLTSVRERISTIPETSLLSSSSSSPSPPPSSSSSSSTPRHRQPPTSPPTELPPNLRPSSSSSSSQSSQNPQSSTQTQSQPQSQPQPQPPSPSPFPQSPPRLCTLYLLPPHRSHIRYLHRQPYYASYPVSRDSHKPGAHLLGWTWEGSPGRDPDTGKRSSLEKRPFVGLSNSHRREFDAIPGSLLHSETSLRSESSRRLGSSLGSGFSGYGASNGEGGGDEDMDMEMDYSRGGVDFPPGTGGMKMDKGLRGMCNFDLWRGERTREVRRSSGKGGEKGWMGLRELWDMGQKERERLEREARERKGNEGDGPVRRIWGRGEGG